MSSDDDYPELDVESDENEEPNELSVTESHIRRHLLGKPPDSFLETLSDEHNDDEDERSCTPEYRATDLASIDGSNASEFPLEGLESHEERDRELCNKPAMDQDELDPPPEEEPVILIDKENDVAAGYDQVTVNAEQYAYDFMQLFFTASLVSSPLQLRDGFTADELDFCLKQRAGVDISQTVYILLGEDETKKLKEAEKLTDAKIEYAYILERRGWLKRNVEKAGRFFPVLPESEKEFIEELIDGAEYQAKLEQDAKKRVEEYATLEDELRAMYTFNMICELMNAYQKEFKVKSIKYSHLSTAFVNMVTKQKYTDVYVKYCDKLPLEKDELWNNEWWKKYTGRSSMKKFIEMPAYSGITTNKEQLFSFRDDVAGKTVKLFDSEDKKRVEDKWNNDGKPSGERRGSGERGRYHKGDGNYNTGRQYQNQKRPVVPDPSYVPTVLTGGMGRDDDDGSLEPIASSNHPRRRGSTPTQDTNMHRQSTSPVRDPIGEERSKSPPRLLPTAQPPTERYDPFGGPPVRPRDGFGGNGAAGGRGGYESRPPNRKIDDYGETSSEDDFSSEGEYSDEDDAVKEQKKRRRAERESRKRLKAEEKRKRPRPPVDNSHNRFNVSSFPKAPEERSPTPPRSRAASSSHKDWPPAQSQTRQSSPPRNLSPEAPSFSHSNRPNEGPSLHDSNPPSRTVEPRNNSTAMHPVQPSPQKERLQSALPEPVVHPMLASRQRHVEPEPSRELPMVAEPMIHSGLPRARRNSQQTPVAVGYRGMNRTRSPSPPTYGRDVRRPENQQRSSQDFQRERRPQTSYQPVDYQDQDDLRPLRNQSENFLRDSHVPPPQQFYQSQLPPSQHSRFYNQQPPLPASPPPPPPQPQYYVPPDHHQYQRSTSYEGPPPPLPLYQPPPQHPPQEIPLQYRQQPMAPQCHQHQTPRTHQPLPFQHHNQAYPPQYAHGQPFQQPHQSQSCHCHMHQQQPCQQPPQFPSDYYRGHQQQPPPPPPSNARTLMSKIRQNPQPPQQLDTRMHVAPTGYPIPNGYERYPQQHQMPPPNGYDPHRGY